MASALRVRGRLRQSALDVAASLAVLERCGLPSTDASLRTMATLL